MRPQFILCRSDGEPIDGDFSFYAVSGPDDWAPIDGIDFVEKPEHYVILEVAKVVGRRTLFPSGATA